MRTICSTIRARLKRLVGNSGSLATTWMFPDPRGAHSRCAGHDLAEIRAVTPIASWVAIMISHQALKRYAGATALHGSSGLSGAAALINDQTADAARQALTDVFGRNAE